MTKVEQQIQNLLLATTRMETAQETTTKNVDKLVKIVENDICTKGHCKDLSIRMTKNEEDIEAINSLPNKILWRAGIVVITISVAAIIANFTIISNTFQKDDDGIKDLRETIKILERNQIKNYERYKIEQKYKSDK